MAFVDVHFFGVFNVFMKIVVISPYSRLIKPINVFLNGFLFHDIVTSLIFCGVFFHEDIPLIVFLMSLNDSNIPQYG